MCNLELPFVFNASRYHPNEINIITFKNYINAIISSHKNFNMIELLAYCKVLQPIVFMLRRFLFLL